MTRVWAVIAMLWCFSTRGASAQTAIEAYELERPKSAGPIMERMRAAFSRLGVESAPATVRTKLRHVGRPGVTDAQLTYADFVARSDKAFTAFMHGMPDTWPTRRRELEGLIAEAYANPAIVAVADGSRELMTRTYATLALCLLRLNDKPSAYAVLAEQMRSYPDLPFTRGTFGSEPTEHYNQVRAAESMKALGTLVVEVDQPNAQIYVNEFLRGPNGRFNGQVFAGTYRVMVLVGGASMRYEVVVEQRQTTRLALDWSLERALTASSEWVGLTLRSDDRDAEELARVHALARKLGGESSLVVLDVTDGAGGQHASATRYEHLAIGNGKQIGKLVRRGRVAINGDASDDRRLDALARYIVKGTAAPDVVDTANVRRSVERARKPAPTPSPPPRVAGHRERGLVPLVVIGAGVAAMIAGGALFALDEDADPGPMADLTYVDRAPYGVAIGAAGVAAIGVGAALWWRGPRSTPTVAVGPSSAIVGWAGAF